MTEKGKTRPAIYKLLHPWWAKVLLALVVVVVVGTLGYPAMFRAYTGDKTGKLTFESSVRLTDRQFAKLADELETEAAAQYLKDGLDLSTAEGGKKLALRGHLRSKRAMSGYDHIQRFRDAGIFQYEGPKTCLTCHETITFQDMEGKSHTESTMDNVINTAHFKLFGITNEFTTFGYDGRQVNKDGRPIPVGKIDRACGIPGSFTWTGWAALIEAKPKHGEPHLVSDGCGQCHIGGMYGPPSDHMLPVHFTDEERNNGIDCLICHSDTYDMNERYVIDDGIGLRWNQDRSMRAALSVGVPTDKGCLRCHAHNHGGDTYEHNPVVGFPGHKNQRISHNYSKRGAPYNAADDVHAAIGMDCIDCHKTVGHKIARGAEGVDLVSNDLPGVDISCANCHGDQPHSVNAELAEYLNMHSEKVACQTCHITKLQKNAALLIDWANPVFNEEEGLYIPNALLRSGDVRKAIGYLWYNGNGTFLANALGDNASNPGVYNPLMENLTAYHKADVEIPDLADNDFLTPLSPEMLSKREEMVKNNIMPVQKMGTSKIKPFHLFNARMYEDMNNQGPFGAMIMPFDYKTYYETGDSRKSVDVALTNPMVKRMYQEPFKIYMMDEFMKYFGILEGWKADYPLDKDYPGKIESHWMRQMGTIALDHGIKREGFSCRSCHTTEGGLLDFKALGYKSDRVEELQHMMESVGFAEDMDTGMNLKKLYGENSEQFESNQ